MNQELVALYWSIGKSIDKRIQEENWSSAIIANLAKDLQTEFSGSHGFSKSNLYLMVSFYRVTQNNPIFQTPFGKLKKSKTKPNKATKNSRKSNKEK